MSYKSAKTIIPETFSDNYSPVHELDPIIGIITTLDLDPRSDKAHKIEIHQLQKRLHFYTDSKNCQKKTKTMPLKTETVIM